MELVQPGGGGGGTEWETPVGDVDGINTTFLVANDPLYVVIDGIVKFEGLGYSYSAPTITTDSLNPPVYYIRSFYNT